MLHILHNATPINLVLHHVGKTTGVFLQTACMVLPWHPSAAYVLVSIHPMAQHILLVSTTMCQPLGTIAINAHHYNNNNSDSWQALCSTRRSHRTLIKYDSQPDSTAGSMQGELFIRISAYMQDTCTMHVLRICSLKQEVEFPSDLMQLLYTSLGDLPSRGLPRHSTTVRW